MVNVGLLVRFQAKPGKADEVADFLRGALPTVEKEPGTVAWFAIRIDETTFGIFDASGDDAGRQAHLAGPVAAALRAAADELLTAAPVIEPVDVLAAKMPG